MDLLRFEVGEVAGLAERMGLRLTESQAGKLAEASAGCPLAVRSALQYERDNHDSPSWSGSGIEFLRRHLLKDLSKLPGFRLLLVTSIVDSFTLVQAEFIGADPQQVRVLEEMEARGLGGWSDDQDATFRMHPLPCEVLRREFEPTDPVMATVTYRPLGQWFERQGDDVRAFDAAIQGKDWTRAGNCLRGSLLKQGTLSGDGWRALSHPPISLAMSAMLDALEAEMLLAIGRGSDARTIISRGRNRRHPRLAFMRARALLRSGRSYRAAASADQRSGDGGTVYDGVQLLLIAASAAEREGERESAEYAFDRALETAREVGLCTPFAMMPRSDLMAWSDRDSILLDLVERQAEMFKEPGEALRLTKREQVVLKELAGGSSVAEIAETLPVAVKTVKNQSGSLCRKLGVSDRGSAVATARRRGLL